VAVLIMLDTVTYKVLPSPFSASPSIRTLYCAEGLAAPAILSLSLYSILRLSKEKTRNTVTKGLL
jgi:hypothetical protein